MKLFGQDAERAALACVMLNNSALPVIRSAISSVEDFTDPACQYLWGVFEHLDNEHTPIDYVTVYNQVMRDSKEELVPASDLASLGDHVPTSANADAYAQIVSDSAMERRAELILRDSLHTLSSGAAGADYVYQTIERIQECARRGQGSAVPLNDLMDAHVEWLSDKEGTQGMFTGIPELDANLETGIEDDLIIIGARPSVGKTSLMLSLAVRMAPKYGMGLIISLETSKERLMRRLNTIVCPHWKYSKAFTSHERHIIMQQYVGIMLDLPLRFIDGELYIERVVSAIRQHVATYPDTAFIAIDYLQLFQTRTKVHNDLEKINYVLSKIHELRKRIRKPIFLLSQLSRDENKNDKNEPTIQRLRGSGEIEQYGDIIWMLHKPLDVSNPEQTMRVIKVKHRDGPASGFVDLRFFRNQFLVTGYTDSSTFEPEQPALPWKDEG